MLKMELQGVNLDMMTNQPVVILKDSGTQRYLPIWIGQNEATAIMMEIEGIRPGRPLTHDLLRSVIETLKADVVQIVIDGLKDGTFFAKIHLQVDSQRLEVDSRPSDAIALAVRAKVPIFAEETVIDQAAIVSENEEEEVEKFRTFLNQINPEDFQE